MEVPEVRVWSDAWCCAVNDPTLVNGQRPSRLQKSVQPIQHRWAANTHTKKMLNCKIKHLSCALTEKKHTQSEFVSYILTGIVCTLLFSGQNITCT